MTTSALRPGSDASSAAFFDTLLSRQSCWPLNEPGPSDAHLSLIFDAAMRAPDHGALRPWRFAVIRDDARAEFGNVLIDVAARRDPGTPRADHERRRQLAYTAPLVIAIGVALSGTSRVPEIEQMLAVGAATMNMLNAIHALGYGGFWATGADAYDANLQAALDFEPSERVLGFLFVGTPGTREPEVLRPSHAQFVREWIGPTSV
jgi:nitroreductase